MNKLANVVIVGRTNVGKSTLFNKISQTQRSIVLDQEGVTRDCIMEDAEWNGVAFNLVDTGGISLVKKQDFISQQIYNKVEKVIQDAAAILFVCDIQVGITEEDKRIARKLLKLQSDKCKIFLVINKVENDTTRLRLYEFNQLGFDQVYGVSAHHSLGIGDLLDAVVPVLHAATPQFTQGPLIPRITLVGRPNAGKSSLMNCLTHEDFSIVSAIEGTTREALRKRINFNKAMFELVDTAGIRRQRTVEEGLETMMVKNSLHAIRHAHMVLLLMDASEPHLSAQVLKLAEYAFENGSALILLVNKFDLFTPEMIAELENSMLEYEFLMKKIEILRISCLDGTKINKVLPLVETVWERYETRLSDIFLTDLFKVALLRTPLYKNGKILTFYKAIQTSAAPMRIDLIVRNPEFFGQNQFAFYENVLRKAINLKSVPVIFNVRTKKGDLATNN
ncbi:ribosome biogenesis GTPase Der [Candidatus Babeliales bacterium]|nr:ribosome biogenesis GTPase Der [Candidatus Babeliales bacterium]MBP9843714.1 ribosome biogenesis GTPase Der [Candidatus Babeliales bacterium]